MRFEIYIIDSKKPEGFYKAGMAEYEKRLGPYCRISCRHIKKEKDLERILAGLSGDLVYSVLPGQSTVSSEDLASMIRNWESGAVKTVHFLLGYEAAEGRTLNLSCFTMPAGMSALILYEQIYRAYRIIHHMPYHK